MKNITEIISNQQTPKAIRLAAYCRVSSNSEDQLHSFAAQIRYYTEYIKRNTQYQLVDIYADEGITGTCMDKRNEFCRLMQDCKKGMIDRIIVKSVSRFARNTEELLAALRMLSGLGVSVYFEEQGIDTAMLNSEMIVTFPGIAAQQESIAISGNMRWSYKKRMESGEFNCCTPAYGFKLVNGQLEINESEANVIRRIFDLYLQGFGKQSIANLLNQEGVCRRYHQNKWYIFTIDYVLNNERYVGDALLQKTYTAESLPFKRKRNAGEHPQYYVENSNPAIVSRETYAMAQALQKQRSKGAGKKKNSYMLSSLLKCSECGKTYRRQIIQNEPYWICSGKSSGETSCNSRRLKERDILDTFQMMIWKLVDYRKELLLPLIKQVEEMQWETNCNHSRIKEIDTEIANLSTQSLLLSRLHTKGILNASEYAAQSLELNNKITDLRSERKRELTENEDNELLDNLNALNEFLQEAEVNYIFDSELFEQTVLSITVKNSTELTFKLLGNIELTEQIYMKERCKTA